MSTRGLHCVYLNGEYKCAHYNHFDSYPEHSGLELLNTVRNMVEDRQLEAFKFSVSCLKKTDKWDEDKVEGNTYEAILHGEIGMKLYDDLQFASDSLFNEWTYVLDLDANTFEVYAGFNKIPLTKGERFYGFQICPYKNETYYPVRYVASFDLDNLPTDDEFLSTIRKKCRCSEE